MLILLIAGDPRAWLLAVASAFVGVLLGLMHVAALGPHLLPDDFGVAYAASNLFYYYALTDPPAALGRLASGLTLDLAAPLLRR